jgi:hypothetical protein
MLSPLPSEPGFGAHPSGCHARSTHCTAQKLVAKLIDRRFATDETPLDSDRGRQVMNKFRYVYVTLALTAFAAAPSAAQVITIDVAQIRPTHIV